MSTSSDFNMLRLEAPRDMLQIKNKEEIQTVEIANPVDWMRAIVNQQCQAEQDLRQLIEVCGDTVDRTDQHIQQVEKAYYKLSQGTQYIYERMEAKEEIAEAWVRNELTTAANVYQLFTRQIWEAIIERNLPIPRPSPGAKESTEGQLATMLTPDEIARLVGAGIAAARGLEWPANERRIHISRLKMQKPGKLNGKSMTAFNQWWEALTMYLDFYPENIDKQKIAWIRTLLTETALV